MKKQLVIIVTVLLNICFVACNSAGDKTNNNSGNSLAADQPNPCHGIDDIDLCKNAGGIANIAIDVATAQKMMLNFKSIFKTEGGADIRAFEPVYWLDKCVIDGIVNYLRTQTDPTTGKKFDGIRIYMACESKDNGYYGGEPYKRRTSIFIFPTITIAPVPPATSDHKTVRLQIPLIGICSSTSLQDYSIAYPQIKSFDTTYRKIGTPQLKDSLSSSIWIDSCVVFTLQKLINLPNANIDGVNVNMAAYDGNINPTLPVRGRFKSVQSTLLLVPTHLVGEKREDYWTIVDCLFNHIKKMDWYPAGLNHGELCPQQCE